MLFEQALDPLIGKPITVTAIVDIMNLIGESDSCFIVHQDKALESHLGVCVGGFMQASVWWLAT